MFKNVAGQKIAVVAYDTLAGAYKTGDSANITATISLDGGGQNATNNTNPTELGNGIYIFDSTQAESNADLIALVAASSTANVIIEPVIVYTQTVMRGTDIGDLNNFDPATDTVARVTLVDTTTTNTDMVDISAVALEATVAGLNDFNPTTDTVAHVTLVDTTTTNSDMVNISALALEATVAGLNNITVAGVLAGVVDGTIDLKTALKNILAVTTNNASASGTDPKVIAYKDSAGTSTVVTHSIPTAGTGRTKS